MEKEYIVTKLCYYDPRYRMYDGSTLDNHGETRKENCSCDNCFYGRHELANKILELQEENNELGHSLRDANETLSLYDL